MFRRIHSWVSIRAARRQIWSSKVWVLRLGLIILASLLLSACDVTCDIIPSLPSCQPTPRPTLTPRATYTIGPTRTNTAIRTSTPVRTATPVLSSKLSISKSILTSNPSFESNLDSLNTTLANLSSVLKSLDSAKTALAVIDSIKAKSCGISDCWTVLTQALDAVASGSGSALTGLDSLLRSVLTFKTQVDAVGSLNGLRSAVSTFRSSTTEANLSELISNINAKSPALRTISQNLVTVKNTLNNVNTSVILIQKALNSAKTIASIPFINELVGAVDKVSAASNSAYSMAASAISPLNSSMTVMDSLLMVK